MVLQTPIRVLVVDDETSVREFVERVLREAGYETSVAHDGEAARELVQKNGPPKLLVTDEMMPRMTGHDLARWIRTRDPSVKVLYLTAFSDRLFEAKQALWQDEAFLEKPCTLQGLLEAVSMLLHGRIDPAPTPPRSEQP